MYDKVSRLAADEKYALSLVHVLHNFSIIFRSDNSGSIDKDLISLDNLKEAIDKNKKLFDTVLDVERALEMATKAYTQVLEYFKIVKEYYDSVTGTPQLNLLESFKSQLENQIETLKNYYVIV